jgi:hypothetical protein
VHGLLGEVKAKWQSVCFEAAERQKRLEDALLCSGQFRDALQSLCEWLGRVEPTLAESMQLNGDLESVLALIEDNQQFQQQLQYKADQVCWHFFACLSAQCYRGKGCVVVLNSLSIMTNNLKKRL